MSILKSTKTGAYKIKLTGDYLLNNGWYLSKDKHNNPIVCLDKNRYLHLKFDEIKSKYEEDNFEFWHSSVYNLFKIPIETLGDLNDVEKFWKENKINKKRKIKQRLLSDPRTEVESLYWSLDGGLAKPIINIDGKYIKEINVYSKS